LAWLDANDDLICCCGATTIVKTPAVKATLDAMKLAEKLSGPRE
jgi:hypothetical protein